MRRSISPLTAVLTASLTVAGLAIMLSATGSISGAFAVWMTLLSFFGLILVITWRTAMHYPTKLTFLYLLVLVTAGSWVSYTVTTLGLTDLDATYANTGAILMTLFQNIMGCLVAVLVFERMEPVQPGSWNTRLASRFAGSGTGLTLVHSVGRFGCSSRAGGVFSFPGPSDVGYRRDYD